MSETTIQNKAEKLPFPVNVKLACPNPDVQAVASEIVDTGKDKNSLFSAAGNVHYFVRDHYVDVSTGTYGIERLIENILRSNNAVFPLGIEKTEFRATAISISMYASEVVAAVRNTAGFDRYPDGTVYMYLSVFMTKNNKVSKIKLSASEDCNRECCKPRTKFYIVEQ